MNTVRMGFQFVFSSTIYLACCLDLSEGYSSIFCSNDRKYRLLLADGIFVSTGSHSKMPLIVWLKQRKFFFSQLWKLVSPKSRCQQILVPVEGFLSSLQMATFLPCPHMMRDRTHVSSFSHKNTSPIGLGPHPVTSLNLCHVFTSPMSNTVTYRASASTYPSFNCILEVLLASLVVHTKPLSVLLLCQNSQLYSGALGSSMLRST